VDGPHEKRRGRSRRRDERREGPSVVLPLKDCFCFYLDVFTEPLVPSAWGRGGVRVRGGSGPPPGERPWPWAPGHLEGLGVVGGKAPVVFPLNDCCCFNLNDMSFIVL